MQTAVVETSAREELIDRFQRVHDYTEELCRPLQTDDYQMQSIVQTSLPKWHIAHVSWFVEAVVLPHFDPAYQPFNSHMDFLFNSHNVPAKRGA